MVLPRALRILRVKPGGSATPAEDVDQRTSTHPAVVAAVGTLVTVVATAAIGWGGNLVQALFGDDLKQVAVHCTATAQTKSVSSDDGSLSVASRSTGTRPRHSGTSR